MRSGAKACESQTLPYRLVAVRAKHSLTEYYTKVVAVRVKHSFEFRTPRGGRGHPSSRLADLLNL